MSCFAGTNTLFDLNEMSFLPTELRTLVKDRVNDLIVPAMGNIFNRWWGSLSQSDKDGYIEKIETFFTKLKTEMDNSNIEVNVKSPSP